MFDLSTPCLTEKGEGLAHGSRFYPTDQPRWIAKKGHGIEHFSIAFTYLDDKMGEVLDKGFTPEAQAEIDRMNRAAQLPGFFAVISKE
jgi:hypothetical protein